MKRILALIASPRGTGNCVNMAREVCRNLQEEHELSLLRLSDFNIKPCRGCYRCLFGDKRCVIDDDFQLIIDSMGEADAYIISVPTYFLGANALLKLFLDRGLAFYGQAEKIWGKPSIGIGVTGIDGKEGSTLLELQRFQKVLMGENKGSVIVYGALPGEALMSEENRKTARALGMSLFGKPLESFGPSCPVCRGTTFRFLEGERIRCMVCSNEGTIRLAGGEVEFHIKTPEHQLIESKNGALEHEKWLVGMKERYNEMRDELGELTREYLQEGKWIKPGKE